MRLHVCCFVLLWLALLSAGGGRAGSTMKVELPPPRPRPPRRPPLAAVLRALVAAPPPQGSGGNDDSDSDNQSSFPEEFVNGQVQDGAEVVLSRAGEELMRGLAVPGALHDEILGGVRGSVSVLSVSPVFMLQSKGAAMAVSIFVRHASGCSFAVMAHTVATLDARSSGAIRTIELVLEETLAETRALCNGGGDSRAAKAEASRLREKTRMIVRTLAHGLSEAHGSQDDKILEDGLAEVHVADAIALFSEEARVVRSSALLAHPDRGYQQVFSWRGRGEIQAGIEDGRSRSVLAVSTPRRIFVMGKNRAMWQQTVQVLVSPLCRTTFSELCDAEIDDAGLISSLHCYADRGYAAAIDLETEVCDPTDNSAERRRVERELREKAGLVTAEENGDETDEANI